MARDFMQKDLQNQQSEIDLQEIFLLIWRNKLFIIIITSIITILAIVYSLRITPVYEAKAIIEIGQYKKGNEEILVDDTNRLVKELEVLNIEILKNIKNRPEWINSISTLKGQKNFIEISSYGFDNEKAKKEIEKVTNYIAQKHTKKINEVIENKKKELKEVERAINTLKSNALPELEEKISLLKNDTLPAIEKKLTIYETNLKKLTSQLSTVTKSLTRLENENASLAALALMEKRDILENIEKIQLDIINLRSQQKEIISSQLPKLYRDKEKLLDRDLAKIEEEKNLILLDLQPHNYQNSRVVGQIMTNDFPIKPNKKMIVIIAFISGFMLSIFSVFFIEFFKGIKNKNL